MIQMRDPSANTHIFILVRDFDKASKPPTPRGHRCERSAPVTPAIEGATGA